MYNGPGGGAYNGPGGGLYNGPKGGLYNGPGGGLYNGPGGGLYNGPGGGLYNGPDGKPYTSNIPPWPVFVRELRRLQLAGVADLLTRMLARHFPPGTFDKS